MMIRAIAAMLLVMAFTPTGTALAQGATAPWMPQGQATMRWFGLKIYDISLSAPPGFSAERFADSAFSLELIYARKLYGKAIAERSLDEIKKQNIGTEDQHRQWAKTMENLFPDVAANDRLIGVHTPGVGAEFFYNGKPIGRVPDAAFSNAFFSIWLSPKTSEPALRQRLIGTLAEK